MYEIKSRRLRSQIYIYNVFSFIFKENHVLLKEDSPSEIVIVEEELDGIDKDDIRNLEDLLVLINEECGNPKLAVDGGELTININQKMKPGVLQT